MNSVGNSAGNNTGNTLCQVLDGHELQAFLPARCRDSHKGMYGQVLIIGGGPGMPGSVQLAAMAALRTGAGLVSIATLPDHARHALSMLPEAMIYPVQQREDLLPLLAKATVCVLGPGLGENDWASMLFDTVLAQEGPLLIDASGLRILARKPQKNSRWILTPHPGEAAALLHCQVADIQANRLQAVQTLQQQYGGTVILKGAGSLVKADEDTVWICTHGNPGMSSAGMGDVLSGVIGALLAQGLNPATAARLGVWAHSAAADAAAHAGGERGLLASDLMPFLRELLNTPRQESPG